MKPIEFTSSFLKNNEVIYVHGDTGVVTTQFPLDSSRIVEYWSERIFKSKSIEDYSAQLPYAQGRLYYVFRTIVDFFNLDLNSSIEICDFAAGQGALLDIFRNFSPSLKLRGTEHSANLTKDLQSRGFDIAPIEMSSRTDSYFHVDVATVNWTLSCCANPYDFLLGVRNNTKEKGWIVVAESSRILVPFKKPLSFLLTANHPPFIHPYYFSKNSLCALLQAAGYAIKYINRFYDSDALVVIAQKLPDISKDANIVVDDPREVIEFFDRWNKHEKYFMDLFHQ
jgi:hypothetical protein